MKPILIVFLFSSLCLSVPSCSSPEVNPVPQNKTKQVKKELIQKVDSNTIIIQQIAQSYITNQNASARLKAFGDTNPETNLAIYTNKGKMVIKLYQNTPLHRANFVMLAKKKFFDQTLFYRIINNFMIQGGNSDDPGMRDKIERIGRYRIDNEINKGNIHKKGTIAMAVSPEEQSFGKKSSAINFYIIEGRKMNLDYFESKKKEGKTYTQKQIEAYTTIGGAPHLDGDYTVFGEIISGMNVLDKISNVPVDDYDWPKKEVIIDSIRAY